MADNIKNKEINKVLAEKQKEIDYWKGKCWILANTKSRLCFKHEKQEASANFNESRVSFEYYIEHAVGCVDCETK